MVVRMTTENGDGIGLPPWKAGLFATGLPLRYDAARTLVARGFTVDTDYYAAGRPGPHGADASAAPNRVDIHAHAATPFTRSDRITSRLELLVACCPGDPETVWVFPPDPGRPAGVPSPPGRSLRIVDRFSPDAVSDAAASRLDAEVPDCQPGMILDPVRGSGDAERPRAEIARLQLALPRLFADNVLAHFLAPLPHNVAFLFCPILVTSAPIRVLNDDLDDGRLAAAADLEEITESPPFGAVRVRSGYGPAFETRCREEITRIEPLQRTEEAQLVERMRARNDNSRLNLPFTTIGALMEGERYYLDSFFNRFIVCSAPRFPDIVDRIKKAAADALRTRKPIE
jgi:hypothetical protein